MPINTGRVVDTVLGATIGLKHVANQNQANYQSTVEAEARAAADVRQQQNERAVAQDSYNNSAIEYNKAELERPSSDIKSDIELNNAQIAENAKKYEEYNSKFQNPDGSPTGVLPTKGQQSYLTRLTNKKASLLKAQESLKMEQDIRQAMLRGVQNKKGILENKTKDLGQSITAHGRAIKNKADAGKKFGVKGDK